MKSVSVVAQDLERCGRPGDLDKIQLRRLFVQALQELLNLFNQLGGKVENMLFNIKIVTSKEANRGIPPPVSFQFVYEEKEG